MANIGAMVVELQANITQYLANMNQAAEHTQGAVQSIEGALDVAKGALAALGIGVTVSEFAMLVKGSIDAADNLRDMSQKTGIAVETLNGLGFAAGQAGGSLESMVGAAGKLNKTIEDAAGGGKETIAAFGALGISVTDAAGNLKKADVVMAEVADQFVKFQDGPEKSALALALFGKAGVDMIPLLNDGGDAMRENTAYAKQYSGMTTELSDASDNFNDTMGKLAVQQKSFGNAMATALLPILQSVTNEILGASEQSDKFALATDVVRTVLETFVVVGSEVAFTFKAVGNEIGGIMAQIDRLAHGDLKGFNAISDMMAVDAAKARKEHDAFIAGILDRTPKVAADGAPPDPKKPAAPRLPGAPKPTPKVKAGKSDDEQALEDGAKLVAKLRDEEAAYGLTGVALLSYKMTMAGMSDEHKRLALASQTTIDALKAEDEEARTIAANQKKAAEDAARMTAQNNANVEQISIGLMSEVQREEYAHQLRLEELQFFHDARLENVASANAMIEAENARHEQTKAAMHLESSQIMLGMAQSSADQLYSALQQAGMEQTALGKAMFFAQKAIQVATIIVNTEVAAAAAQAGMIAAAGATAAVSGPAGPAILAAGIAAGAAYASVTRVMGYATAGLVAGTAIASAEGGYDIPRGVNPVTQLHEEEMVLPKAQANVIRGLASNGGGAGGAMKLTIVNNTRAPIGKVTEQRISATERALIIEEAVSVTASTLADPNSKTSRAMSRNFNVPRSR